MDKHSLMLDALGKRAAREKGIAEDILNSPKGLALIRLHQEREEEYTELKKQYEELKLRKFNVGGRRYVTWLIKEIKCRKFQASVLLRALQSLKPVSTTKLKDNLKKKMGSINLDLKNLKYRTNKKIKKHGAWINSFEVKRQRFYQLEIPTFPV